MGASELVDGLKKHLRSTGGNLIRRLHLLPGGTPDGLGEDAQLTGTSLDSQVLVFFPDTPDSLYQIEEWYPTLGVLNDVFGVTVVCMDSRTAREIRGRSRLKVITIARDATLDELVSRSDIKICLYVNYNPLNTLALYLRSMIHVSMLHGDSDKTVSVSNQIKAYDFAFVAGHAAIDRLDRYTMLFDAHERCIAVGYPELDYSGLPAGIREPNRHTVLYAPTWEGGHPSMCYSSVHSHGAVLVRSLRAEGYDVIYRPHPLTGVRLHEYGEADREIKEQCYKDPRMEVSAGTPLAHDFHAADLLIADVSAVANSWLRTGRPLIVTDVDDGGGMTARTQLLDSVPRLTAADARETGTIVRRELTDDPTAQARKELIEYYYGDVSPGASIERTIEAIRRLIALRDELWKEIRPQ